MFWKIADNHEFIITTKLQQDSAVVNEEKMRNTLQATYPKAQLAKSGAVFVSLKGAVDENRVNAVLAGLDAEARKIGDPGKSEFIILKKEPVGKKKSASAADGFFNRYLR